MVREDQQTGGLIEYKWFEREKKNEKLGWGPLTGEEKGRKVQKENEEKQQ